MYKTYLTLQLIGISLLLGTVLLINYTVDPGHIYHSSSRVATKFVAQLIESEHGVLWPNNSWNLRDVKSQLAQQNESIDADCAIVGSSHVMGISSIRQTNPTLIDYCPKLINLGVSGGTLEDYLALTHMLIANAKKPKTIVFGIAPWALDFNRDSNLDTPYDYKI